MKKYSISPLMVMFMAAFIVIDGTVFSLCSVLCAILHELAHIIALRLVGGRTKKLRAGVTGFSLDTGLLSYRQEAFVSLAGPFCSLCLFIISIALVYFNAFSQNFLFFAVSNLALFIINALPIYPLDCGRALFCLLCLKFSREKSALIIKALSFIFLLPLGIVSVIILIRSGFNLSLLIICIYLLILLTGATNI